MSLMPHEVSRRLDLRTSRVSERIAAIDDFVEAGYEVHLNFSLVVIHEGWLEQWSSLLGEIDDTIGVAAKQQLACEVILLTHNRELHEVNLGWHPRGESSSGVSTCSSPSAVRASNSTSATAIAGRPLGGAAHRPDRRDDAPPLGATPQTTVRLDRLARGVHGGPGRRADLGRPRRGPGASPWATVAFWPDAASPRVDPFRVPRHRAACARRTRRRLAAAGRRGSR
jgi:hypothetical protein